MLNFTAWPEMIAWPYLILNGWLPYRDIAIAHNPLLIILLTEFYRIVGVGVLQLKLFTWGLIVLNSYLTFFVTKEFWNKKIAITSTLFYVLLCFIYQGNGLWFDLALTPFAILLFYLLKTKSYLWSSMIFALGFLTKQTFVYFLIPATYYILHTTNYKKNILNFLFGSGIIIVIFLICLGSLGIIDDYYNWAIKFGIFFLPQADGQVLLPSLRQFAFTASPFLLSFFSKEYLILSFAFFGLLGVYPRFELFHFQPALPFLAIALSTIIIGHKKIIFRHLTTLLIICFLSLGIYRQIGNTTRFFEPKVHRLTESIQKTYAKEIYVINYWDNIYAHTDTLPSVKPLIPYIPWYLNYEDSKTKILTKLKIKMPDMIVIGERDIIFPEIYAFTDKYYTCRIEFEKVELCIKNK